MKSIYPSTIYPKIGDIVTYETRLTNAGNITATDVFIKNTPIIGASFINETITVNGACLPGVNPYTGFILPSPIAPNDAAQVKYNVKINSLPSKYTIDNIAEIPYQYKLTNEQGEISDTKNSNIVETLSNFVCLSMVENVSKTCATLDDVIYYSVNISNYGNISAINTLFSSNIQSDTTFILGSVTINGTSYPYYNPQTGFNIGSIDSDNSILIVYKVVVNNIPSDNILYNQSDLSYNFLPNPTGGVISQSISSNRVETSLNISSYTLSMDVNKTYAMVGDSLVYTVNLNNTGSADLYNVSFYDNLPSNIEFTPKTVFINGINYPSYDPTISFTIPTLKANNTVIIVFGVNIISAPLSGYIINKASFTFSYQTCSDLPIVTTTEYTNEITTFIVEGNLSIIKATNKSYGKLHDIITYSFNMINTGNVPLTNVSFIDVLNYSLQFVSGSVIVNNINKTDYNPYAGFLIGTLNVGQSVKISFDAKVINIPTPNTISNSATGIYTYTVNPSQQPITDSKNSNLVTTTVNKSDVILSKQVDKIYSTINDILTYTLTIKNTGTVSLTNINILDLLQSDLQFVTDSVIINGISKPGYNPNLGFAIDNISPSGISTIIFQAKVVSVPANYKILNNYTMTYEYLLPPSVQPISDTKTSNTVTTNINILSVNNVKTVNRTYTTASDTFTYTSTIKNNGTISLYNTKFTDIIPFDTSFIAGSVTIDSVPQTTYNPQEGFELGTIAPNQSITIKFNVKVVSLPNAEKISNQSNLNYSYELYPDRQDISYGNTSSNTVSTVLIVGGDDNIKSVDRTSAKINDIITYTIHVSNAGNSNLFNVSYKDIIQIESSFITDSVYINNVQQIGYNPSIGFPLPNLAIGDSLYIQFKVKVNSIPSDGKLYNKGVATYSYYIDPEIPPITESMDSNITTVTIYDTIINATKSVDKSVSKIDDILNYTIIVSNQGNTTANTVFFGDILDSNLEFVPESVYIGATKYSDYNPNTGFPLPNINGGGSITIKFAAKIISRPPLNIIYNNATITYKYTIDDTTYDGTMKTNITNTTIDYGELTIVKSLDKAYGNLNDYINYTITIKNTGSVNTTNLLFKDIIDSNALFNSGSVTIDGITYPDYNPDTGFALTDLTPNQYHIIYFSTKIITMPSNRKIDNTANTTFTYQLGDSTITKTTNSNTVTTYVNLGKLAITKSVNKTYATLNDIVTYTFNISNTGNVVCNNIIFQDIVQNNAIFISQSVAIDDSIKTSYVPNTGFPIPDINPGSSIKVVFKVQIKTLPSDQILYNFATTSFQYISNPNSIPVITSAVSNTVKTIINVGSLTVIKSTDKLYATIGDTITYSIDITNSGTVNALAISFRDVIKTGLTFISGSVTIGGTSYPSYNPYDGFSIGSLTPGQSTQVKFKVFVSSLPSPNTVINIANVIFSYYVDPSGSITTVQTDSNSVSTVINISTVSLTKAVNKTYATSNEVLTYNFVLSNTGTVDLTNVVFFDNLQSDILFNLGSVIVDGTPQPTYDPTVGFNLGTIPTLTTIKISFTATIISKPTSSSIIDFAYVTYSYKINPSGESYTKTAQSNSVYTTIVLPNISATKTVDLSYATIGNILNYTIIIKNTGNYLLSSITFVDTLSSGAIFKLGSVYMDDVNYPNYNPITGFSLPNLIAGNTTKIQFQCVVSLVPSPPVITNYAIATAKCVITQIGTTIDVSTRTNDVMTNINVGALSTTKFVNKSYAIINDTLTYTNVIINTGNVTATNIYFKDLLQSQLTFVNSSVKIGDTSYISLNPSIGFNLPDMEANTSITITFDAVVNSLPVPPIINNNFVTNFKYKIDPNRIVYSDTVTSNTVTTNIVKGELTSVKSVDKYLATVGDDLTYVIAITNTGNVTANDIFFKDIPCEGITFKTGSVKINNITQDSYNPFIGFGISNIGIGNVTTIEFKATVVSIPSSNTVTNTSLSSFTYFVDPKQTPYTSSSTSNTVTTNIALGELDVTKSVDKAYATRGDILIYTITIKNVGNINVTDVKFLDATPVNSVFILGSVIVNSVKYPSYNPQTGFNLNTILPGQTVTVSYEVQVISQCSL